MADEIWVPQLSLALPAGQLEVYEEKSLARLRAWSLFSHDKRYRYMLGMPTGAMNTRVLAGCGANPSVAGTLKPNGMIQSDNTISRLRDLAKTLGYGWFWMVNARSFVSTDPKGVPTDPEAIGEHTDLFIEVAARDSDFFLCCYGHLAGTRAPRVLEIVRAQGKVPHALGFTEDGTPRHPRGVPSDCMPVPIP